jgi:endogenous inhibitor of DNA gyrase (YacG/DUF329 family)
MTDWYEFDCPACEAAFEVDSPARTELRAVGCPECGESVTASAFEALGDPPDLLV